MVRQLLKACLGQRASALVVVIALASLPNESAATLSPSDVIEAKTADATHMGNQRPEVEELVAKANLIGTLNVLVVLKLPQPYVPEGQLPDRAAIDRQRAAIAATRESLLASLGSAKATEYRKLDPIPVIALKVDAAAMRLLAASPLVDAIQEDAPQRTLSPEYLPELARLTEKVAKTGTVNVIVGLKLPEPYKPESKSMDPRGDRASARRDRTGPRCVDGEPSQYQSHDVLQVGPAAECGAPSRCRGAEAAGAIVAHHHHQGGPPVETAMTR